MSNSGYLLLSKVLDNIEPVTHCGYNITTDVFFDNTQRDVWEYISNHIDEFRKPPTAMVILDMYPDFQYIPNVTDEYGVLVDSTVQHTIKSLIGEYVNNGNGLVKDYTDNTATDLLTVMEKRIASLRKLADSAVRIPNTIKNFTETFKDEMDKRSEGKSTKMWKSMFDVIGTYESGNMYVGYGRSGRGKSYVLSTAEVVNLAQQGARVGVFSLELKKYQLASRLYSVISATSGLTTVTAGKHGEILAGFDVKQMQSGKMDSDVRNALVQFLDHVGDFLEGEIFFKAVDDRNYPKDVRSIVREAEALDLDVIIIDPFYYLDYEKNKSNTSGGDAAATSVLLRNLLGASDMVGIVLTQADEVQEITNDSGQREISLPQRSEVKKTSALLEDASTLIALDSDYNQYSGIIGINKGRDGGEGNSQEFIFAPTYGVVKPISNDVASRAIFSM